MLTSCMTTPKHIKSQYLERRIEGSAATRKDRRMTHVQVAEQRLGRRLRRDECVHHINENKHDNRPENLLVCMLAYHNLLHKRMRAEKACGDPNAHRCMTCQSYERQDDMVVRQRGNRTHTHHAECIRAKDRERSKTPQHRARVNARTAAMTPEQKAARAAYMCEYHVKRKAGA